MTEYKSESDKVSVLVLNKFSWHHPRSGGAEQNLKHTLGGLVDQGHSVNLLIGSNEPIPRDESVNIHQVGLSRFNKQPWDVVMSYLFVSIWFYYYSLVTSPDVIYTVHSPLPWPVWTRNPRITIFHHISIDSFYETHPFPQNVIGAYLQKIGVYRERNKTTIAVSKSTREELVSYGHSPETISIIKNGIDIDEYQIGSEAANPRITYLGALEEYKGADRVPEIHRRINEFSEQTINLSVAGRSGPIEEKIIKYCDDSPNAKFHGYVSKAKKLELLRSSWVMIAPSRVEGWGIAVIEANACGTPVVGSDVSGLRDSIQDGKTGRLVNGANTTEFAETVLSLVEDDEERQRIAENARYWAEKHTWDQSVNELSNLIRQVANEGTV